MNSYHFLQQTCRNAWEESSCPVPTKRLFSSAPLSFPCLMVCCCPFFGSDFLLRPNSTGFRHPRNRVISRRREFDCRTETSASPFAKAAADKPENEWGAAGEVCLYPPIPLSSKARPSRATEDFQKTGYFEGTGRTAARSDMSPVSVLFLSPAKSRYGETKCFPGFSDAVFHILFRFLCVIYPEVGQMQEPGRKSVFSARAENGIERMSTDGYG